MEYASQSNINAANDFETATVFLYFTSQCATDAKPNLEALLSNGTKFVQEGNV